MTRKESCNRNHLPKRTETRSHRAGSKGHIPSEKPSSRRANQRDHRHRRLSPTAPLSLPSTKRHGTQASRASLPPSRQKRGTGRRGRRSEPQKVAQQAGPCAHVKTIKKILACDETSRLRGRGRREREIGPRPNLAIPNPEASDSPIRGRPGERSRRSGSSDSSRDRFAEGRTPLPELGGGCRERRRRRRVARVGPPSRVGCCP
jgi:hypothetical protein